MLHWSITLGVTLALALAGLAFWAYRRHGLKASGRDDRYAPERLLTPEQVHMLDYLRDTFPDQVVLPNLQLKDMLSVRRSSAPLRAKDRLRHLRVDFVVCGFDGRPVFAFDIEQYQLSDAKAKARQVQLKNRILKTAGVRFLLLKDGIHRMPSPADFRQQLNLAALPRPPSKSEQTESVRQQLESKLAEFDTRYRTTGFRDSDIMDMSSLMDLGDEAAERAARQRPPSTRPRVH